MPAWKPIACALAVGILLSGCAAKRQRMAIIERPGDPRTAVSNATSSPRPQEHAELDSLKPDWDESVPDDFNSILPTAATESSEPLPPAPEENKSNDDKPEPPGPLTPANESSQSIDLTTALMLTSGNSPQVAFAQARIAEASAQLDRAEALWLPSIHAGANYNKHEGRIQEVGGNIIDTSRNALYYGAGANAVGAASPAVPGLVASFHLTDAIFQPRIAERTTAARQFASRAACNDALLKTALAYEELLRAAQELAIAREVEDHARELDRVTGEFARTGQGLESDYDRARTELSLRTTDVLRAQEAVEVASARLAEQIRWDANQQLFPAEPQIVPIELVKLDLERPSLVATALEQRPEISESRLLIAEACERLRREQYAPLIPSVLLGVSYGGFGGGIGGDAENIGDRFDGDAVAYWEVRNLGFGERAARREARARIDQARVRQIAELDRVAREVVEAHAQVRSRHRQIEVTRSAVTTAEVSYKRNVDRIVNGQGLPIEALQSIQALATSRREYLRAVADYNVAQFTLQRALGWPIQ